MYKYLSKLLNAAMYACVVAFFLGLFNAETMILSIIGCAIGKDILKKNKNKKIEKENKKHQLLLDEAALIYFSENDKLVLNDNIDIRSNHSQGFDDLEVYYKDEVLCLVKDFKKNYHDTYLYFENAILNNKPEKTSTFDESVIEQENYLKRSLSYINEFTEEITNSKIKEDLYHTSSMIKFIMQIVEQYPAKIEKLSKLEKFYLPALISILESYTKLIKANRYDSDVNEVENKLIRTIYLVNEALTNLSDSLCDDEILDLSSDMSVLETMLKRDGLVKEGTLDELKK